MSSRTPISSHEQWHAHHRDLVNTVLDLLREYAESGMNDHPWFVGNLGDDLWEWMRHNLPLADDCHCDWCDCEVAAAVWPEDHPDGPYPARVGQPCPRCGGPIPNAETPGAYPGALSRVDNETEVCSRCGSVEAVGEAVTAAAEAALAEAKAERIVRGMA